MSWRNIVRPEAGPQLEDDYVLGRLLGKGAFGVVHRGCEKKSGTSYAVKSISKAKLITEEDVEDVRREVEILTLLSGHGTIASLTAAYEDRTHVHVVIEFCEGGELFERIINKGTFSEAEAARFFRQMVEMVAHCHSLMVVHRDLKPENFLLTDATDAANVKGCDFGLSDYFKPGQHFSQLIGSAYYVAPEVLKKCYGPECDLWSLGVILYILISGLPPFYGDTEQEIFTSILKGYIDFETQPWPQVSEAAKDLVRRLLTMDVSHRATAEQALQHPWLKEQGVALEKPLDSVVISRLRNFAGMTKLKKAAVLAAAQHLNYEEIHGLKELFKSFDANGDGHITLDELREGLQRQGKFTESEVLQILQDTDVDGSGTIDYGEFLAATVNLNLLEREEILVKAFQQMDKDGSGTLTPDEVAEAMGSAGRMSEAEAREMMAQYDTNQDGVIDLNEFIAMLRMQDSGLQQASQELRQGVSTF